MPVEEICSACPNTEYKTFKKKYKRIASSTKDSNSSLTEPTLASSIMPASLYTCKAAPDYSKNPDYIKCLTCLAELDAETSECKSPQAETKMAHKWCNSITQTCYSKAVYDANNTLAEFSRGCASLTDLGDASLMSGTDSKTSCVQTSDNSNTCVQLCNSQFCNNVTEVKEETIVLSSGCFTSIHSATLILLNLAVLSMF